MVTGAIAYRILENDSPRTVSVIKTLLEKHPWYADRWRDDVEKLAESQRGEMLFMLAARWADDIRMQAKLQRQTRWHYMNFPFKPASEPPLLAKNSGSPLRLNGLNIDVTLDGLSDECRVTER
jgi:hypothetical protein